MGKFNAIGLKPFSLKLFDTDELWNTDPRCFYAHVSEEIKIR